MPRFRRPGRFALVGALAVSLSTLLMPVTAGAVTTGTVTAITNGVTVTYSSPNTSSDSVFVMIYPSPHTCSASDNPGTATYLLMSEHAGPSYWWLGASPQTLQFGSTVAVDPGSPSSSQGTIAAGNWMVCLVWNDVGNLSVLSSAAMTAVDPTPPTTATTVAPTTTTAGGGSVTPAFTG